MKKIFSVLLTVSAFALSAGENLLENPGFEEDFKGWAAHNNWGKAPGTVRIVSDDTAHSGKQYLRMEKEGKGGAVQLISKPIPLKSKVLNFSYWWRKNSPDATIILFEKKDGKLIPMKNEFGKDARITIWLKKTSENWEKFQKQYPIPENYLKPDAYFKIKMYLFAREQIPTVSDIDDIEISQEASEKKQTADRGKIRIFPPSMSPDGIPPLPKLDYTPGIKDGNLTKNGIPYFYIGSTNGGEQADFGTLWMLRLMGETVAMVDWSKVATSFRKKGDTLEIRWKDAAPASSVIREMTRQNILVEFDGGKYGEDRSLRKFRKDFPVLDDFFLTGHHFYCYDHHTDLGRQMHFNDWKNRFRYYKGHSFIAFECWNELGYTPSHARVIREFREYAKKKYGTLEEANRIWHKDFKSWNDVFPPHLAKETLPGAQAHVFRQQMREKYFEMYYDFLRLVQLDFAGDLDLMKAEFRKLSDAPFAIDWRGHQHYTDGYCAQDINLISKVIDLHLLHTWVYMFDYNQEPARPREVLTTITTALLYHNFLRSNSSKPIWDPEDIVLKIKSPGHKLSEMKKNCLGQFPEKWKFTLESDDSGIKKGYYNMEFDDSKWGRMAVPGCWDETDEYRGRQGVGWYRADFDVPAPYKFDYEDGSRKFLIYGKGIAQKGTIWVNGTKVGTVAGWNKEYQIDIGHLLKFGKRNQITIMVNGNNYSNGLRFYLHILPHDKISTNRLEDENSYATRLWDYLVQGSSGVMLWHWDYIWRPFMAKLNAQINSVAPMVMRETRRKEPVQAGILMPYLYLRGLPCTNDTRWLDYMNVFGAISFSQTPVAALDEDHIASVMPETHPVVFYPNARIVWQSTFDAMKKYVLAGGTAVLNFDSMRMNFERYRDMGVDEFSGVKILGDHSGKAEFSYDGKTYPLIKGDISGKTGVKIEALPGTEILGKYEDGTPAVTSVKRGKGSVLFIAANPSFEGVYAIAAPLLKNLPKLVEIADFGTKEEFPYLTGQWFGTPERFLLYIQNWGGKNRKITCRVPEKYLGKTEKFRIRNVREPEAPAKFVTAEKLRRNLFALNADSLSPAVWLFEPAGSIEKPLCTVSPERKKMLERINKIDTTVDPEKYKGKKVLFFARSAAYDYGHVVYPQLTAVLKSLGYEICSLPAKSMTPELLKKFDLVCINPNAATNPRDIYANFKTLGPMLLDYVRNGGSLFLTTISAAGTNVNSDPRIHNRYFGPLLGYYARGYARDDESCGYGDPLQIRSSNIRENHPAALGVKQVQFYTLPVFVLRKNCVMKPLVLTNRTDKKQPNRPVIIAGDYGKGRIVAATGAMWFQPFRVEEADNLQLLRNICAYLTHNEIRILTPEEKKELVILPEKEMLQAEEREKKISPLK